MSDSATTERTDEKGSAGSIRTRPKRVLSGEDPFDEATMIDDDEPAEIAEQSTSRPYPPARLETKGTTSV